LISGFRASEAHPGVGFLTCRAKLLFSFLTDFRFCLSALAHQGFVSTIFFLLLLSHRAARTTIPCRFFASHRAAVLVS
jgi:hypothetical protein